MRLCGPMAPWIIYSLCQKKIKKKKERGRGILKRLVEIYKELLFLG